MWFDKMQDVAKIAARNGTSVFVVPRDVPVEIEGAAILKPEEKTVITVEQVRTMTGAWG